MQVAKSNPHHLFFSRPSAIRRWSSVFLFLPSFDISPRKPDEFRPPLELFSHPPPSSHKKSQEQLFNISNYKSKNAIVMPWTLRYWFPFPFFWNFLLHSLLFHLRIFLPSELIIIHLLKKPNNLYFCRERANCTKRCVASCENRAPPLVFASRFASGSSLATSKCASGSSSCIFISQPTFLFPYHFRQASVLPLSPRIISFP